MKIRFCDFPSYIQISLSLSNLFFVIVLLRFDYCSPWFEKAFSERAILLAQGWILPKALVYVHDPCTFQRREIKGQPEENITSPESQKRETPTTKKHMWLFRSKRCTLTGVIRWYPYWRTCSVFYSSVGDVGRYFQWRSLCRIRHDWIVSLLSNSTDCLRQEKKIRQTVLFLLKRDFDCGLSMHEFDQDLLWWHISACGPIDSGFWLALTSDWLLPLTCPMKT